MDQHRLERWRSAMVGLLDMLACPDCGGRLHLLATIAEPRLIARVLAHLGPSLELPRPVPPRQSSWMPAAAN